MIIYVCDVCRGQYHVPLQQVFIKGKTVDVCAECLHQRLQPNNPHQRPGTQAPAHQSFGEIQHHDGSIERWGEWPRRHECPCESDNTELDDRVRAQSPHLQRVGGRRTRMKATQPDLTGIAPEDQANQE